MKTIKMDKKREIEWKKRDKNWKYGNIKGNSNVYYVYNFFYKLIDRH